MSGKEPRSVLITGAEPSYEDQLAARKRKYVVMMACRVPCLVLAGVTAQTWWLALTFLAISVPLPWAAVLIANDRPPRKTEKVSRYHRDPAALERAGHRVIDG
ncbi:DUF3099 domain-containing protein [Amycolatopsis sp. NPDC004378]